MLVPGANGKQRPWILLISIIIATTVYATLTPYSWLAGGPFYLVLQILSRIASYTQQTVIFGGPLGFFLPTRYLWPFELAFLLLLSSVAITHVQQMLLEKTASNNKEVD
jgi:NADH:ubiquinone oxidoreductase subunit 6 (subunit J)